MSDYTGRRALITGAAGQDGSYLTEQLLEKGYEVWAMVRYRAQNHTPNLADVVGNPRFHMVTADLTDQGSLFEAVKVSEPDEVYNLAAFTHVGESFKQPQAVTDITGTGAVRLLEAVRRYQDTARFYQAGSSEMFGQVRETPQTELTPFHPRSPYAVAKVMAYHSATLYREAYGMYVVNGIVFNHESPRRPETFVTRKITAGIGRIMGGTQTHIELGNMDAKRDWGYAPEYTDFMWRSLLPDESGDYVAATGETHTVREFVEQAFLLSGLGDWTQYVRASDSLRRPAEVDLLIGDPGKAWAILGWSVKVRFHGLVSVMLWYDIPDHLKPKVNK